MTTKTQKKTAPKVAKVAPKEEIVEPVAEKKEVVITCPDCGKEFTRNTSGQKYCPECGEVRARARRKAAQKRRKMHRRDELNDLRQLKADIVKILDDKKPPEAVKSIRALVE